LLKAVVRIKGAPAGSGFQLTSNREPFGPPTQNGNKPFFGILYAKLRAFCRKRFESPSLTLLLAPAVPSLARLAGRLAPRRASNWIAKSRSSPIAGHAQSPGPLPRLHDNRRADDCRHMIGSTSIIEERAGGFIPRGRNAFKVGPQGYQLANPWNPRHLCDQLVFHRKGRDRRFDRRHGDHHEDRMVLSPRAGLGGHSLGAPQTGLI
jgi:hypothetical protein